ncbi:hypothetical protein [Peribacillus sp. SCS-37]
MKERLGDGMPEDFIVRSDSRRDAGISFSSVPKTDGILNILAFY